MAGGDDDVIYDWRVEHPDGAIEEVYVRRAPSSNEYPSGLHYRFHYGYPDDDGPIIQFDNGHGDDEHHKHTPDGVEDVDFPGLAELLTRFQEAIDNHEPDR